MDKGADTLQALDPKSIDAEYPKSGPSGEVLRYVAVARTKAHM